MDELSRRAPALRAALLAWYRRHARDLPWRRTRDPYAIWLSEVMCQQTRVETVIPYYERWLAALPTVDDLAAADEDRVFKLWEGLGYYRRARNLHRAAQRVVADGGFPIAAVDWMDLPGVGRYTAGAIASIVHGEPAPVVDGNVKRVFARLFAIDDSIDASATIRRLWSIAEALVDPEDPGAFNQALMELGARVCTPRRPQCLTCPLSSMCAARAAGRQADLPVRRAKRAVPHRDVALARVRRGARVLLVRRPPDGLLAGLWDFPHAFVEAGESPADALHRALAEIGLALPADAACDAPLAETDHAFTHLRVTLRLYDASTAAGSIDGESLDWVATDALRARALPTATRRLLDQLDAAARTA
ncbi:MAG: A/G-specific adenine glycosylase [Acidobacteriota bacterium]